MHFCDEAYDKTSTGREEMESILGEQDRLNQRYKVVQGRLVDMEGKITRHRMDCERFVEELQELGLLPQKMRRLFALKVL